MPELIRFEIAKLPEVLLIGKEIRHNMHEQMQGTNPLPAFWDRCFAENAFDPLEAQADFVYDASYVGVMIDWERGDGNFSYIVGMLMKAGAKVPDGYYGKTIPATDVAIGWIRGKSVPEVCAVAHESTERALREKGRACDGIKWCMELYNCPRFTEPDENGDIILDYYIPLDAAADA